MGSTEWPQSGRCECVVGLKTSARQRKSMKKPLGAAVLPGVVSF